VKERPFRAAKRIERKSLPCAAGPRTAKRSAQKRNARKHIAYEDRTADTLSRKQNEFHFRRQRSRKAREPGANAAT
jgi:hypothetical protein